MLPVRTWRLREERQFLKGHTAAEEPNGPPRSALLIPRTSLCPGPRGRHGDRRSVRQCRLKAAQTRGAGTAQLGAFGRAPGLPLGVSGEQMVPLPLLKAFI